MILNNHRMICKERRLWMLVRPQYLIEENLYNNQPDIDYWRNNFSMGKETFSQMCQILRSFMKHGDNFV